MKEEESRQVPQNAFFTSLNATTTMRLVRNTYFGLAGRVCCVTVNRMKFSALPVCAGFDACCHGVRKGGKSCIPRGKN